LGIKQLHALFFVHFFVAIGSAFVPFFAASIFVCFFGAGFRAFVFFHPFFAAFSISCRNGKHQQCCCEEFNRFHVYSI
jgi:hypothetical protein